MANLIYTITDSNKYKIKKLFIELFDYWNINNDFAVVKLKYLIFFQLFLIQNFRFYIIIFTMIFDRYQ